MRRAQFFAKVNIYTGKVKNLWNVTVGVVTKTYTKGLIEPKKLILLKNRPCAKININAVVILDTNLFI